MAIALELEQLKKTYPGGVQALRGIDLKVEAGVFYALLGPNGAGKSTTIGIISSLVNKTSGRVSVFGYDLQKDVVNAKRQLGLVPQEFNFNPFETVQQIVVNQAGYYGVERKEALERSEKYLKQLDLWEKRNERARMLSGGMKRRLMIARALMHEPKLLILDEPTASLTEQETAVLLNIIRDLQNHGIACIYISHKLNEVKAISDTICVIRDGQHIGTREAAGMSEDDIITMMVGRELTALYPNEPHTKGDEVLRVENLTAWHPVNRHIKRVNNVSFSLHSGEILGIAGLVGAGRTEAVQCLFGVWPGRWEGTIYIDGQPVKIDNCQQAIAHGIAMVPEDRKKDGIVPVMAVGKNITLAALDRFSGALSSLDDAAEQQCILQSLARLKVKTSSPELAIGRLSGGNQQKAILARCLLLNPRILILDEPTRGIDIGAKYEIYKLINQLVQQGIAVIVISSELPEVLGLSDRVLVMHEGKLKANLINQNLTQEQVMEAALRSERHVEKQSV